MDYDSLGGPGTAARAILRGKSASNSHWNNQTFNINSKVSISEKKEEAVFCSLGNQLIG